MTGKNTAASKLNDGEEALFAQIIIDISHEKVDRPFTYRIPRSLVSAIRPGSRVRVPFGVKNKERTGYCVGITDRCTYDPDKVKEIIGLEAPGPDDEETAIKLALWMKEHYGSTMIMALRTVLPARKAVKPLENRTVVLKSPPEEIPALREEFFRRHQVARLRLLESLVRIPEQPFSLITSKLHIPPATVRSLEKKGILEIRTTTQLRNPVNAPSEYRREGHSLNSGQQAVVDGVIRDFDNGTPSVSLVKGVTGSGKTEVYIRIIEEMVRRGRQAIVLIPEIALTYQTLLRFYGHFGNRVSVINSSLSDGERYDQYERARKGEIDVIIGPRSALFVPFPRPGIIVIDEEHENSYKNENMPKYHARETAVALAGLKGACVLLGSATPSLEASYRARTGQYRYYELAERATGQSMARVHVADMRAELMAGNRSVFSEQLKSLIDDRLRKKEQIMLFLNRRGYAGFVSCRACGHVMKCPHCDVSLSWHRNGRLMCHYCGYTAPAVKVCPECGSGYIGAFRAGTEQIESLVLKEWPGVKVLRMDADTTSTKNAHEKILSAFANEEADILIGTQMIVKGHDFPKVTLVGILMADMSLNTGDYRAAERTFALLVQAAGRAGRGELAGECVIQTYEPDNYAIRCATKQDYDAFYAEEIRYREILGYPPVCHMMAVQVQDPDEDSALAAAGILREAADSCGGMIRVIGPSEASIRRIKDIYRFVLYVKDTDYDKLIGCRNALEEAEEKLKAKPRFKKTAVQFDYDPVNPY